MNPLETIKTDSCKTGIQAWYLKTGESVYINSPCIFTEGNTLTLNEVYEVHDFTEKDTKLIYIKLLWVYLKGYKFHVVGIDITNGDIKTYGQRLNAPENPCSFLICDLLYFDEDLSQKLLKTLG